MATFTLRRNLLGEVRYDAGIDTEETGDDGDHDPADLQATADAHAAPVTWPLLEQLMFKVFGILVPAYVGLGVAPLTVNWA